MGEYIERGTLLEDIEETVLFSVRGGAELPTPEMRGSNKVVDRIKSAPTADVVEVVRCKDCKHWKTIKDVIGLSWAETKGTCDALYRVHDAEMRITDEEHFCSYGAKTDGKGEVRFPDPQKEEVL